MWNGAEAQNNDAAMSSAGRGERGQRGQPSLGACGELQWVYVGGCKQRSRKGNDGPHTRKKMIPREPARGGAGDARILAEVLSFSEDSGGMASAQALRGSKAVVAGESARSQENARFPALARTPETVASLRRQVVHPRVRCAVQASSPRLFEQCGGVSMVRMRTRASVRARVLLLCAVRA